MDRILITMPKEPRAFFIAMAVVQAYTFEYVQEVAQGMRYRQYQFTLRMDEKYEKYELPLKVAEHNHPVYDYTGWSGLQRSEFNCFIEFNFEAAEKLACRSGKHITEAFGAMIGCSPKKWPILPPPVCKNGKGIAIIDWNNSDDFLTLRNVMKAKDLSLLESFADPIEEEIETAEAVIGPASAFTYIAACYKRKVVEIFPNKESYIMYNSNEITEYQSIIGEPTVEDVLGAWQQLQDSTDLVY